MFLQLIGFLLVGSLTVYVIQKFPFYKLLFIGKFFEEGKFLKELLSCDLCFGTWLFTFLSFILKINFIFWMFDRAGLIVVDQILTGIMASFMCHIFKIGWMMKFGTNVIE